MPLIVVFWRSHIVNWAANLVSEDRISKSVRNGLYKAMGVRVGPGSSLAGGSYVNGSDLSIGARCFINRQCYFDLSAPVTLGDDISVGTHCVFVTANHRMGSSRRRAGPVEPAPIRVEDGAWLGTRVTVLPGVTIGRGAVVASGSVVTRSVPANTLVAGVPAIVKRTLEE